MNPVEEQYYLTTSYRELKTLRFHIQLREYAMLFIKGIDIKPIRSKKDYKAVLKRIDELWDAKPNTSEGDELDALATLVESYEVVAFPMAKPEPLEAIKFRMDQMGLKEKQ
jgi:hypothetical protein